MSRKFIQQCCYLSHKKLVMIIFNKVLKVWFQLNSVLCFPLLFLHVSNPEYTGKVLQITLRSKVD